MKMLIIGPPGSGKGTQAARISEHFGVVAVSTGDLLRANISAETPLGAEAKQYIDAGNLVPDSTTNQMVRDRLAQTDLQDGFLLDGYPRNRAQVDYLDGVLAADGEELDAVLHLKADDDELVRRLLGRGLTSGRSDDTEDVIRHRLSLYHEETEPIVAEYAKRINLLIDVEGIGDIDEVTHRIVTAAEDLKLTSGQQN